MSFVRTILALVLIVFLGTCAWSQETVLRAMIHPPSFAGYDLLVAVARQFERDNPGVRVSVLSSAGAQGETEKLKFTLIGRLPLDVTWVDVTEFGAYLADDVLLDLQPYFDRDATFDATRYFPGPLAACKDGRGHLYGLPSTFTPYVFYVNTDLLAAEGFSKPDADWTWDDLVTIARKTTRDRDGDGRVDQWGVSLTQWLQAIAPWIWQNGGRLLNDDRTASGFDEPRTVEALTFLKRLMHEEKVASLDATFENQIVRSRFQQGQVALYGPVGYWETYRFKSIRDFHWDVVPCPRNRERATSVAMRFYVVPRTSRHPELAYKFVRALAEAPMQRALARIGNGVPGLIEAARSEDFLKPNVAPDSEQVFLDVLEHARFLPVLANWRKIEDLCKAELDGVLLLGNVSPAEGGARMARKTDAYLARERDRLSRPRLPLSLARFGPLVASLLLLCGFIGWRRVRVPAAARRKDRHAFVFLAPWAFGFVVLILAPALGSLLLSFTEWSPLRDIDDARWIAGENYSRLLVDETFRDALGVTGSYALLSVPLGVAFSLLVALLLNQRFFLVGIARTLAYVPTVLSPVIVGALWRWILEPQQGLLNQTLALLGIEGPGWTTTEEWVIPGFVLMSLWTTGAQTLVFLAALQGLDRSLLDAARIDGASALRRFWHVTLPALGPVVLFNGVVSLISAFQIFAQPYVMTQGGPGNASRFLMLYLYENGFRYLQMGYASAIAWILFAIVFLLTLIVLRSSRRFVHYGGREA